MRRRRSPALLVLLLVLLVVPSFSHASIVNVLWDYIDSGQTGFRLLRCTGNPCTPTAPLTGTIAPTARAAADGTAVQGTTYTYGIVAVGNGTTIADSPVSTPLVVMVPVSGAAAGLRWVTPPQASTLAGAPLNTVSVEVIDAYGARVTTGACATTSLTLALSSTTPQAIPQSALTVVSADSEESTCGPGQKELAKDGNINTLWHTQICPSIAPLPHTIVLDAGTTYNLTRLTYQPRTDSSTTGTVGAYEVYVSPTCCSAWGSVAASGTFAADQTLKTVTFMPRSGRYVQFKALSETSGGQVTSAAEIQLWYAGSGSGGLSGTLTVAAVAGLASFPGLSVSAPGVYTLDASAGTLAGATSTPFTITNPSLPTSVPLVWRLGQ